MPKRKGTKRPRLTVRQKNGRPEFRAGAEVAAPVKKATPAATTRREVAAMPVEDVQKLVHELQVHQIELQMQNEELRRTQRELEAARERLRVPYDAAPVGFLTLDVRGVIQEANLAAARLLNFDRVKLAGKKLTQFIALESQDVFYLCRRQLLNTGEKQAGELDLLRPGGPPFTARLEMVVDGSAGLAAGTRCLVMVSDITEQKRAEAALRESERRERERAEELAVLIEAVPTPVVIVHDPESRHMTGNRAANELVRIARGREISLSAPDAVKPVHFKIFKDGRELRLEELPAQRAARGEAIKDFELELVFDDGTVRNLLAYGTPLLDGQGRPRGAVHTLVDITGRKQIEAALQQSEERYRMLFTSLVEGFCIIEVLFDDRERAVDYRFLEVNPAFEKHTGLQNAQGQLMRSLAPEHEEHWFEIYGEVARTGEPVQFVNEAKALGRWYEVSAYRLGAAASRKVAVLFSDISERRRAEEKLARLAAIVNYSDDAILSKTLDGRITSWNPGAERLFGYAASEAIGKLMLTFIPPERAQEEADILARIGRGESVENFETVRVGQGGQHIEVSVTISPIKDQGRIIGASAIARDISERRKIEAALRQARDELEQRVRERTMELTWANTALRGEKAFSDSLIQLAPAVIAVIDGQGNLIRTNTYAEQLTGHPFAETQGRNMISLLVPVAEQPRVRQLMGEVLQGRAVLGAVAPLRTRDGSLRQIEWFTEPLINAAGEFSAVLAIGHDITERKAAEEALRRSERHLSNFFNQAPIGLVWLSAGGTVLRANQAQLDLLGCSAGDFLGHSFGEFIAEPVRGHELLQWLAARETVRNFRMPLRCQTGKIRQVLVDGNSSWNGNQFEYSSIFLRDITDRINLEREILHISEREHRRIAQDLHDGLGQLLVGAAYLAGTARQDLAAKSLPEARKLRRIWEVINEAVAQTRNLARGLHPVAPEPNGLMAALGTLAERTKKLFPVRCQFVCRQPVLVQDNMVATHLFRIAQEAVTNAIKHGKPGRIRISLTRTAGQIKLTVKDDGSGMPARQRKKDGMGLRIMRYRARMMGGFLTIPKAASGTSIVCTVQLAETGGAKPQPIAARKKRARKN